MTHKGPKSALVIEELTGQSVADFKFMTSKRMSINDVPVYISRCGYTGEDGFEISLSHQNVAALTNTLLKSPHVKMAGLAARDSLRLEAGLCLYGHDLNEEITPVEAGLTWVIGKSRRETGGFLGSEIILPQIGKPSKRRVGLIVAGAPAREHAVVYDSQGAEIGVVTSGCPSPSLKKNIAMAYVKSGNHKAGTKLQVKTRGKMFEAQVVKLPFIESKYISITQVLSHIRIKPRTYPE